MAKVDLVPYIFFKGNAKEAMEFYKGVFGGELTVQTYKESGQKQEGMENKVMHAKLESPDFVIMASDTQQASDKAAKISLSVNGSVEDEAKLRKIFDGLSDGGKVFSPLKKEFWGDTFGSVTDKYNVEWMMNIAAPAA